MSTSTQYIYDSTGNFRAEVIQVDNTAAAVNVSVNLQMKVSAISTDHLNFVTNSPAVIYATYAQTGTEAFNYRITVGSEPSHSGTWTTVITKWCATLSRSGNTGFKLTCQLTAEDDYDEIYYFDITNQTVAFKGYVPDDVVDTLTTYPSTATLGTSVTFKVTNGGSYAAHTDTLSYSIGSASENISTSISVPSGGSSSNVSFTFPTSLGSQFPNSTAAQCTLTLTTKNASSQTIGTRSYTITLQVPSYSYSIGNITSSKTGTYSNIGSSTTYIAGKTTVRFAVPAKPSGQYGATTTAKVSLYYTGASGTVYSQDITSAANVDCVGPSAGTFVCSYRVVDSRGVDQIKTTEVTYTANPGVTISNVSAARAFSGSTTVNLTATGTYDSSLTNNTGTLKVTAPSMSDKTGTNSSGTSTLSATNTQATTASKVYTFTMSDSLGNTVSIAKTVPIAFAYMQIGTCSGKGVAIGKYGSTSGADKVEIGMPVEVADSTGTYKILLGPATVNNTTTWRLTIKQGNVDVCTLDPLAGLIMKTSSGNKTLELSTNGLEIKNVTGTTSRITLESTNGLTFKNASGTTTMNYPAEQSLTAYWRIKNQPWSIRSSPEDQGSTNKIATVTTNGTKYRYLGTTTNSGGTWINIYYSSSYPSAYIIEKSGSTYSGDLIYE